MPHFEVNFLRDQSEESLLDELRRVANRCRRPFLSIRAFEQYSDSISAATVRRRFGSWQAALVKAGLPYGGPKLTEKMKTQTRGQRLSGDDVIAEMKRVQAVVARDVLTTSDFKSFATTSLRVVRRNFRTWTNALKQAGIAQSEDANKGWTNKECLDNIASVWTYYGRQPKFREMMFRPSEIRGPVYKRRWGTWRNALRAFVVVANACEDEHDVSACVPPIDISQNATKRTAPHLNRAMGYVCPRLRFLVFQRDRFKCVVCGRSPATHLKVVLHADHVTPLASGGNTSLENLQTLCYECNMGKGRFHG